MKMTQQKLPNMIRNVVQQAPKESIMASVLLSLQSLRAEVNALNALVAKMAIPDANNTDVDGNENGFRAYPNCETVMANASGAGADHGNVICADLSALNGFSMTAVPNWENILGMVAQDRVTASAYAIAPGAMGTVCHHGRCDVIVDSPVVVGDYLVAGANAGRAVAAAGPNVPGVFAQAREALLSGFGEIEAFIFPVLQNANAGLAVQDRYITQGFDLDGSITGFSGYVVSASIWRDAAMSVYIQHHTYRYSSDGNINSAIISYFDVTGSGVSVLSKALVLQGTRIDHIIEELS